ISTGHVEVAVRTHKDLGAAVREALVECQIPNDDSDQPGHIETGGGGGGQSDAGGGDLRAALAGISDSFTVRVRQIRVVDAVLAHFARRHTVGELEAIAHRIVAELNPASPNGAHERRYLHMSQLPSGEWRGRFSCGPAQGLLIKRALAAWAAPRPG